MPIGISLGWNCYSAIKGTELGLRGLKASGYTTCPFDQALTNYTGVVECIKDDFARFFDIEIKEVSEESLYCSGDTLIWNPHYKFLFNHESPGHANLWHTQEWPGGKAHYITNDFAKFKERYSRRIDSFRSYLTSGEPVVFLITRPDGDLQDLHQAMKERYPDLDYTIHRFDLELGADHYYDHLALMGV